MHPLSTRWPKSAAVLAVIALGACAPDQTVSSTPEVQDFASAARNTVNYSSLTLSGEVSLKVGTSTKLSVRTSSRSRGSIRWLSSNPSAATVNSQGNVTGQSVGTAYVTASGFAVNETYLVSVTPAYTLTSFTVSPSTGTALAPGQTRQFSTQQLWSDGQTRNFGVTYTATGGSISSSGLFTAGSVAGSFMVIANCLCGALDTAFVTVEVPAQLTKITVSPKTVSLNAGATQQFGATANWSTGATTLPPITWSATGGSISTNGLYTAPTTAGTYRVIVAHSGGTLRDTATVTVTSVTAPPPTDGGTTTPPPTSGSGSCPNEPAGYTLYSETTFSSLTAPTGWTFWAADRSVYTEQGSPASATSIAFRHEAGLTAGQIGILESNGFGAARARKAYSCSVFKLSSNYVQHPNGTKMIYPFIQGPSGYLRSFEFTLIPVDAITSGKSQWQAAMYSGDPNILRGMNVAPSTITHGRWYRVELLALSNTPGVPDGTLRWWTSEWNGSSWSAPTLNANHTNVLFSTAADPVWQSWDFNVHFGGQGGSPLPADQFVYLNSVRVSQSK